MSSVNFILANIKDKFKNPTLESIESLPKSHYESLLSLEKGGYVSYYVTELKNGRKTLSECDLVIGYFAKENTHFTFNFGPIQQERDISVGQFEYAYANDIVPVISAQYSEYSISNLTGSAYVIYANLDTPLRESFSNFTMTTNIIYLADNIHIITNSMVYNKQQAYARKRYEEENTFCNRITRFFKGSSSNYTPVAVKAELKKIRKL